MTKLLTRGLFCTLFCCYFSSIASPATAAPLAGTPETHSADVEVLFAAADQPGGSGSAASSRRSRRRPASYKTIEVKNGGTIEGAILYKGTIPPAKKPQIVKDHETCGDHPTEVQLMTVDKDGHVSEAVVYLADISEGKDFTRPDAIPMIDQKSCRFHPHVQIVRARQPVEIVNSDPVAHNINASQRIYTLFNILQPQQNMRARQQFDRPGLVNLRCNVHDWMQAYVHVVIHPYVAITGAEGRYKLDNVPPGKYELVVWQEYLDEQTFDVEVKPGETTKMDILLKPRAGDDGGTKSADKSK